MTKRTRILGVLCELWCWLGPFMILSLVIRKTASGRDPFLRVVTAEVLNVQIVWFGMVVLGMVTGGFGWNLAAFYLWLAWIPVCAYSAVVGGIGAVKAWRGEAWRYPVKLRMVA